MRVFRRLRSGSWEEVGYVLAQRPIQWAIGVLIFARVIGATVYTLAESKASWWDGAWWAVVTQTTTGYGDFAPKTTLGRFTAEWIVMWPSILAIAVITAQLAAIFNEYRAKKANSTWELNDDIEQCIQEAEDNLGSLRLIARELRKREEQMKKEKA